MVVRPSLAKEPQTNGKKRDANVLRGGQPQVPLIATARIGNSKKVVDEANRNVGKDEDCRMEPGEFGFVSAQKEEARHRDGPQTFVPSQIMSRARRVLDTSVGEGFGIVDSEYEIAEDSGVVVCDCARGTSEDPSDRKAEDNRIRVGPQWQFSTPKEVNDAASSTEEPPK